MNDKYCFSKKFIQGFIIGLIVLAAFYSFGRILLSNSHRSKAVEVKIDQTRGCFYDDKLLTNSLSSPYYLDENSCLKSDNGSKFKYKCVNSNKKNIGYYFNEDNSCQYNITNPIFKVNFYKDKSRIVFILESTSVRLNSTLYTFLPIHENKAKKLLDIRRKIKLINEKLNNLQTTTLVSESSKCQVNIITYVSPDQKWCRYNTGVIKKNGSCYVDVYYGSGCYPGIGNSIITPTPTLTQENKNINIELNLHYIEAGDYYPDPAQQNYVNYTYDGNNKSIVNNETIYYSIPPELTPFN